MADSFIGFVLTVAAIVVAVVMYRQQSTEWKYTPDMAVKDLRAWLNVGAPRPPVSTTKAPPPPPISPGVPSTPVRVTAKTVRLQRSRGFGVRYLAVFSVAGQVLPPQSGSLFQGRWYVPITQPLLVTGLVYDGNADWRRAILNNDAAVRSDDASQPMVLTFDYGEEVDIHAITIRKSALISDTIEDTTVELSDGLGRVVWVRRIASVDVDGYCQLGAAS